MLWMETKTIFECLAVVQHNGTAPVDILPRIAIALNYSLLLRALPLGTYFRGTP